ncbi:hypothetical protein [Rhizobium sp. PAMB 3182]
MNSRGAIYIAFGEQHIREALHSAASLKRYNDLSITLFADADVDDSNIDELIIISPAHKRAKVDYISQSPYEYTVYLDNDTEILARIDDDLNVLDRFDIACTQDFSRKSSQWARVIDSYRDIPYAFPEFNSGVIFFRKNQLVSDFFSLWASRFYEHMNKSKGQDQASFRIALWESDLRIHTLPTEFNVRNLRIRDKMLKRQKATKDSLLLRPRIYHWHGLDRMTPLKKLMRKYRPMKVF